MDTNYFHTVFYGVLLQSMLPYKKNQDLSNLE